jgi:hypothetical protein
MLVFFCSWIYFDFHFVFGSVGWTQFSCPCLCRETFGTQASFAFSGWKFLRWCWRSHLCFKCLVTEHFDSSLPCCACVFRLPHQRIRSQQYFLCSAPTVPAQGVFHFCLPQVFDCHPLPDFPLLVSVVVNRSLILALVQSAVRSSCLSPLLAGEAFCSLLCSLLGYGCHSWILIFSIWWGFLHVKIGIILELPD